MELNTNHTKGKFIVLEGVDGSGISTQAVRLLHWLEEFYGNKALLTKEPSEGPVGSLIRQVLTERVSGMNDQSLALLFAADRIDHIRHKILPALNNGNNVICDRFLLSSLAYQGQNLDMQWISKVNSEAILPDITIFIKVNPLTTIARIKKNRFQIDLFEKESTLKKVMENYEYLVKDAKNRGEIIIEIDGEKPVEVVTDEITRELKRYL